MRTKYEDLRELDDYQLENSEQDLRGHSLTTSDGLHLGTIKRMLVDPDRDHVAGLVLEDDRIVPVSEIEAEYRSGVPPDPEITKANGRSRSPTGRRAARFLCAR